MKRERQREIMMPPRGRSRLGSALRLGLGLALAAASAAADGGGEGSSAHGHLHDSTAVFYAPDRMEDYLPWAEDGACPPGIDRCGALEFCHEGDVYGYRVPCSYDEGGEGGDGPPSSFGRAKAEAEECQCSPGPGPTIRLTPGKKYLLTLRNASGRENVVTNLHTHGLHIVGAGNSDDVTRHVGGGGNCLDYVWDLALDHPGGTYWYHAHHHGHTEEQVVGGAFGMLIVEDNLALNPDVPKWAANERLLLVHRAGGEGTGEVYGNGSPNEVMRMDAGQWYRLRVAIVDAMGEPDYLSFGAGCEVRKVASDGVWRSTVPGPRATRYLLTGSSRADFAVRCSSSFHVLYGGAKAATVYVGAEAAYPYEMEEWRPVRPESLRGIAEAEVPDENKYTVELTREGLNNILWDPSVPLRTIKYGEVHEWNLTRTASHPFHLHLYHVMVVQPGGCGEMHEEGEFYDSISGAEYEECRVRFLAADVGQRCVLHCHVLRHEDNGAMGWVDVVGGRDMPRNDVSSPEYACPAGPTRWRAPAKDPTRLSVPHGTATGSHAPGECAPLGEKAQRCGAAHAHWAEECCPFLECDGTYCAPPGGDGGPFSPLESSGGAGGSRRPAGFLVQCLGASAVAVLALLSVL